MQQKTPKKCNVQLNNSLNKFYYLPTYLQSRIIINSQIYVKVHDFNLETLYAKYALKTRLLHAYIILFDANLSRWLDIEVTFWSLIEKKSL